MGGGLNRFLLLSGGARGRSADEVKDALSAESMRCSSDEVSRRPGGGILGALTLMLLLTACLAGTADSDTEQHSGVQIAGSVRDAAGNPVVATVEIYSWPPTAEVEAMQSGEVIPTERLAESKSDETGQFTLSLPSEEVVGLRDRVEPDGSVTLELSAQSGSQFATYFYSVVPEPDSVDIHDITPVGGGVSQGVTEGTAQDSLVVTLEQAPER